MLSPQASEIKGGDRDKSSTAAGKDGGSWGRGVHWSLGLVQGVIFGNCCAHCHAVKHTVSGKGPLAIPFTLLRHTQSCGESPDLAFYDATLL